MARPTIGNVDPQTEFIVCRGVPLDNTYQKTLTFPSKETQLAYFKSKQKFNLVENRYQRVTSNTARIKLNSESVFDCNYICFCNHGFTASAAEANRAVVPYTYTVTNPDPPPPTIEKEAEWVHFPPEWGSISSPETDRWWYAFITDITYVNNGTCDITYEIDVMQSYAFDYVLNPSMVERAHLNPVGYDHIFANRVDEDLPIGELFDADEWRAYLNEPSNFTTETTHLKILFLANSKDSQDPPNLDNITGIPSMLKWVRIEEAADAYARVSSYVKDGKEDNIVGLMAIPGCFQSSDVTKNGPFDTTFTLPQKVSENDLLTFYDYQDTGGGTSSRQTYKAINGKMTQYPCNRLVVSNGDGVEMELRFELFDDLPAGIKFVIRRSAYPSPIIGCFPKAYNLNRNTVADDKEINPETGIYKQSFPVIAYPGSVYQQWWAQNIGSGAIGFEAGSKAISGAITGGLTVAGLAAKGVTTMSPLAGALAGLGVGLVNQMLSTAATSLEMSARPTPTHNANFKPEFNLANNQNCFIFHRKAITCTRAKRIDRFFSTYGYLWNDVFQPWGYRVDTGLPHRALWDYLKLTTVNIAAGANVNAQHQAKITQILLNGITFWHLTGTDDSFVGDYSDSAMERNHAAG